jgi:membrane protease YdiL (CAAX protease family)
VKNLGSVKSARQDLRKPTHTPVSWFFSILAAIVMLWIAIRYWNDPNEYSAGLARYALLLAVFDLLGLFFLDLIDGKGIELRPRWQVDEKTGRIDYFKIIILRGFGLFIIASLVEFAFGFILARLTITSVELALYFIFASICEEVFYRGFIITAILKLGELLKANLVIMRFIAIFVSAFAFMASHLTVYGDNLVMLMSTLAGGILLGSAYAVWRDLTSVQIAHFAKNIVATIYNLESLLVVL